MNAARAQRSTPTSAAVEEALAELLAWAAHDQAQRAPANDTTTRPTPAAVSSRSR